MGKKKKKLKTKSGGGNVNVVHIMKVIEKRAGERALLDDVARVSAIDLRKMSLDECEINALRNTLSSTEKEENLSENLKYINQNYALTDKYNFVTTHRKGFAGKIVNKLLSKLFLAMKIFLDRVVVAQEIFNVKVVRLFNRLAKDLQKLSDEEKRLEEDMLEKVDEKVGEQGVRLAAKIDEESAKLSEKTKDLATRIEKQKAADEDLAKRLEAEAERSDSFAVQITQNKKTLEAKIDEKTLDLAKRLEAEAKRSDSFAVQITENKEATDMKIEEKSDLLTVKIEQAKKDIVYPQLDIDYKGFEDRFRGSQEAIKDRGKQFLKFFHECTEVLDIGCGRGEFIENLHKYGSGAYGIDIDEGMVAECKKKGLNVVNQDAITHLKSLPDGHLDGIFADQLIEHLSKPDIIELIKLAYQKLKKGRYAVFTTPNIKSMVVYANSLYMDWTHVTPVNPQALEFLLESAGFEKIELLFYSEVAEKDRLKKPENDEVMAENINKLNLFLFGPQDYAAIAKKI